MYLKCSSWEALVPLGKAMCGDLASWRLSLAWLGLVIAISSVMELSLLNFRSNRRYCDIFIWVLVSRFLSPLTNPPGLLLNNALDTLPPRKVHAPANLDRILCELNYSIWIWENRKIDLSRDKSEGGNFSKRLRGIPVRYIRSRCTFWKTYFRSECGFWKSEFVYHRILIQKKRHKRAGAESKKDAVVI